jgi:hypothetical protein
MTRKANRGRKLSQPLKCHSGKRYLADSIIALMARHLVYVAAGQLGDLLGRIRRE